MTRPFIDKKSCKTFKLVSRSAEELEAARAEGREINPRVFVELTRTHNSSFDDQIISEDDSEDFENPAPGEAIKYGILFDDRYYDYTKHLKTVGTVPGAVILDAPTNQKDDVKKEVKETLEIIEMSDPTIRETIDALNDNAFLQQDNFEDDFVTLLNQEVSETDSDLDIEEFDKLVEEFKDQIDPSESQEFLSSCEEDFNGKAELTNDEDPIGQFNSILAKLKLGENARIPNLSDFDSDSAFEKWELSEPDPENIETCARVPCLDIKPNVINEIQISKKTGLPIRNADADLNEEIQPQIPKINFGVARPREETLEEKKTRKFQVKHLRNEKRRAKKVQ